MWFSMIQDLILGVRDSLMMAPLLRQMAVNWQNVSFEAVLLSDFAWVDGERLEFYQREFAALGFEPRGDFSPRPPVNGVTGFMRLMGHETEKAHVSLHTTKPALAPAPLRCAITCTLSDGWVVASTDREADAILSQLRLPHAVGLRDCDASPSNLWRETLKVRAQLMKEKNLRPTGDASAKDFIAFSAQSNSERAELTLRQNPLQFAIRRRTLMRQKPPRREIFTGEWMPQSPLS